LQTLPGARKRLVCISEGRGKKRSEVNGGAGEKSDLCSPSSADKRGKQTSTFSRQLKTHHIDI
jgi:hypothetical protein